MGGHPVLESLCEVGSLPESSWLHGFGHAHGCTGSQQEPCTSNESQVFDQALHQNKSLYIGKI